MDISIIIVNYNVKHFILKCLKTIYSTIDPLLKFEVIVIDNASTDGSIEAIQKGFPDCKLIPNSDNVGFSEANNQGIRVSNGDYIMLLNPDTELKNSSFSKMIKYLENNPNISILAPKLLNTDGSLQISCWKFPDVKNIILESLFMHTFFKLNRYSMTNFNSVFEVDFAIGACLMFRKELIDQIGLLDPDLFWMEDVDFCYRAKSIGKIIYYPESIVIHHSGKSLKKNYNIAISNQIISKLKYLKKHFSGFNFILGALFSIFHVLSRLIIFTIISPFQNTYKLKFKAYLYTFKKLINYLIFNTQSVN